MIFSGSLCQLTVYNLVKLNKCCRKHVSTVLLSFKHAKHTQLSTYSCQSHSLTMKHHSYINKSLIFNHFHQVIKRNCSTSKRRVVLGIETSCDDTGAAIVDEDGHVLGECLNNQTHHHIETGGIIPPVARDLHKENIDTVVQTALRSAQLTVQDVDAIATTVKPGLIMSLDIGMKYTKQIVKEFRKPFIPIHHMEAHALTARMTHSVPFPFLTLLVSGGHCLLAVAKEIDDFLVLGQSIDVAPGDAFDKIARGLRLKTLDECQGLSGGRSIELMALRGDPFRYNIVPKMHRHFNCNFSFSGVRTSVERIISKEEEKHGSDFVLPMAGDICASFQLFVLKHLVNRLQRAVIFCRQRGHLSPSGDTLVVSGGVASNQFLRRGLVHVCDLLDMSLVCPPPHLCTDNGIMIAWNGMEKMKQGRGFADIDTVDIQAKCPLGIDLSHEVKEANIKVDKMPGVHLVRASQGT